MSVEATSWALWLNAKLLLNHMKHVAAMPITPMSDQLQLFGIVFNELLEKALSCFFSGNVVGPLLLKIAFHIGLPAGGCEATGYTANYARGH